MYNHKCIYIYVHRMYMDLMYIHEMYMTYILCILRLLSEINIYTLYIRRTSHVSTYIYINHKHLFTHTWVTQQTLDILYMYIHGVSVVWKIYHAFVMYTYIKYIGMYIHLWLYMGCLWIYIVCIFISDNSLNIHRIYVMYISCIYANVYTLHILIHFYMYMCSFTCRYAA